MMNLERVAKAYKDFMDTLEIDWEDENNQKTPMRVAKYYDEFLHPQVFEFTTFPADGADEMVIVKDIQFYSLCAHHHLPFMGVAHVGYIPNNRIVGISKLARTVDWYARRFQNQERITTQVSELIQKELNPKGVAVVLEAEHLCMACRGIKKPNAKTITSSMVGAFKENLNARSEFMHFII